MKKLALYKCFNPVAPTRGATGNNGANGLPAQLFQSTHPHGVRPAYQDLIIPDSEFQSTHPHGVRLLALSSSYPLLRFQSTHPHGVRPRTFAPCRCLDCFNPRTHTGCDNAWSKALPLRRVSIHAPTRGATTAYRSLMAYCAVSIHAPTRGATLFLGVRAEPFRVSIHAPTRGATSMRVSEPFMALCFNPRTHTGCDWIRGAFTIVINSFNPRTHTGCDLRQSSCLV